MSIATRILVMRAQAANRKAARRRRTVLERELAGYCTPAQRADFEATLDAYPDGVTWELREVLARQALAQEITGTRRNRLLPGIGRRGF